MSNQRRALSGRCLVLALALSASAFVLWTVSPGTTQFTSNPIQDENARPGTAAWQLTNGADNNEIVGFASATSVNRGDQISLYVHTIDPNYRIDIYRMGWYAGLGGRLVTSVTGLTGTQQTIPAPDPATGIVDCGAWINPYALTTNNPSDPTDWPSGVYLAKLTGSSGLQNYIIFVVRDDSGAADLLLQTSVNTYQAYNNWGGKSLYTFNSTSSKAAVKISFNRPYNFDGSGDFLNPGYEFDMIRFLERSGYSVSYATDVDTHANPNLLLSHKGFLVVGHDEYWSWEMRANLTNARDLGVSLGFFAGNEIYWQIRYEDSPITGSLNRTIVAYKNNWQNDPFACCSSAYNLITSDWRDLRFTYISPPEDGLMGLMWNNTEPVDANIHIDDTSNWVFANSGLNPGDSMPGLVGYEPSQMYDDAPAGTVLLAHSPFLYTRDGTTHYHDMTVYQAPSGATVFAAGTMQWNWGLDSFTPSPARISPAAQAITLNILNRFINGAPSPSGAISLRGAQSGSRDQTTAITPRAGRWSAPIVR